MGDKVPAGTVFDVASDRAKLIEAGNISDGAALLIRGLIFSGQLSPGDRLPPVRDLAEQLGMSVLTLRVGLKSLETAGYLVTSRGSQGGSRVCDVKTLSQRWIAWMRQEADEVEDMWEFREIVETNIAALAAQRRSSDDLVQLESALVAALEGSHTAILRWNVAFHDALARAAHSKHLFEALVRVRMEIFLPAGLFLHKHSADELRSAHGEFFEAVRQRDSTRAMEAMHRHIAQTRLMASTALEEIGSESAVREE